MINENAISDMLVYPKGSPWGMTSNLIDGKSLSLLYAAYPEHGFRRSSRDSGYRKHYSFDVMDLVIGGKFVSETRETINPLWLKLAEQLLSKNYIRAIEQKLSVDLSNAHINIGFYRFGVNDGVSPHLDNLKKILTQIFYFNPVWCTRWGGSLNLLKDGNANSTYYTIPPFASFSALLPRSDATWHMVSPITQAAEECRLSLQLEFIHEEAGE